MSKHLHIVTHDVPWPADFGGVIDIYYKIKALHAEGVSIHLHCFVNKRPPQEHLKKYCYSVEYYPRKTGVTSLSFSIPYIVHSRNDKRLLANLRKDNYPILFEGIHSCYFLKILSEEGRKTFLRLFNAEHKYYTALANNELNFLKKIYYKSEARLLKNFERETVKYTQVWALSSTDVNDYRKDFATENIHFLPVFIPWEEITAKEGAGKYSLYHGNLSVNENENAAEWLIREVFSQLNFQMVIAGHAPSKQLKNLIKKHKNIRLTENPDEPAMQLLIENAHINILPSFNQTGVKLKLLNALYTGRHCLVNSAGCRGSGAERLCVIAETAPEFKMQIEKLICEPFDEKMAVQRGEILNALYKNEMNAHRIIAWIW